MGKKRIVKKAGGEGAAGAASSSRAGKRKLAEALMAQSQQGLPQQTAVDEDGVAEGCELNITLTPDPNCINTGSICALAKLMG